MGRPAKYPNAAAFAKKVKAYFASITALRPVTERVPLLDEDGCEMLDSKSKPLYRVQQVINCAGEPMVREEYLIPPTILGLCRFLKISSETWRHYGQREGFGEIVTAARERIEQYLEEELDSRTSGLQGIILNLTSNYGWSNKQVVEMGEDTREALRENSSLSDKLALVQEMATLALADYVIASDQVEH